MHSIYAVHVSFFFATSRFYQWVIDNTSVHTGASSCVASFFVIVIVFT